MKILTDTGLMVLWQRIKDLYKKISVSAKQTTTSTADGGTNVMTFTFGDGTSTTLSVKNGSKGSDGAKGEKGDRGPVGETGPQGNSGIADASNKALINDAVTGGETSYLSAEVGKLGILTYDCSKGGTVEHASLQDAINAVPTTFRKVGITIIYKSGDSIYRYALKSNSWSTDSTNWFSVEEKVSDLSKDLQESISTLVENSSDDFALSDEEGNNIVSFKAGHIKTKEFDSENAATKSDIEDIEEKIPTDIVSHKDLQESISTSVENSSKDFALSDEKGNNIVSFYGGHIETKDFDSKKIIRDNAIEYPQFIGKGATDDNGKVVSATNRVISLLLRAQKGDKVCVKDFNKIGSFCVFEYSNTLYYSCVTNSKYIRENYTIKHDKTNFIRICVKPKDEGITLYNNRDFVGNIYLQHINSVRYTDNKFFINSSIPCGFYVSKKSEFSTKPEDNNPETSTGNVLTLEEIYEKLSLLASSHSDYVTEEVLGKDSSGLYDVYRYTFCPSPTNDIQTQNRGYDNGTIPTIYMQFGVHAEEKPCIRAMLNTFIHLCDNWKENDFLSWIRWNVKLVVIPVLCPYSYVNSGVGGFNGRMNFNKVNINRNYDCNGLWKEQNGTQYEYGGINYKGESVLSEVEAKYAVRSLFENADAIAAYDFHTHGNFSAWQEITVISIPSIWQGDLLSRVSSGINKDITCIGWRNFNLPYPLVDTVNSKYIGRTVTESTASFVNVCRDLNIPTASPELMYRYYNSGKTNTVYNIYTDCMNESYIVNLILQTIKNFNNK